MGHMILIQQRNSKLPSRSHYNVASSRAHLEAGAWYPKYITENIAIFQLVWQQKSINVVFLTSDRRIWMNLHNFSTHRQPLLTGDWVLYAWGTKCYTRRWSWGGPTLSGNIWQGTRTACSAGSNACGQGFTFEVALREAGKRRSTATSQRTSPGTGICYGEASWGRCPAIGIRVPVLGGQ